MRTFIFSLIVGLVVVTLMSSFIEKTENQFKKINESRTGRLDRARQ